MQGIRDRFDNPLQEDSLRLLLRQVNGGELKFNELMSDPSPNVFLGPELFPEVEFVELVNTSELALNTQGMLLEIGDNQYRLGAFELAPDSFLVLSSDHSKGLWSNAMPLLFLDWPTYALSNDAQHLRLFSAKGQLLDQLNYTSSWQEPLKSEGGWSLERVDLNCACENGLNWQSSTHPHGASPGASNSRSGTYSDSTLGQLLYYEIPALDSLVLHFDRTLEPISALKISPDLGLLAQSQNQGIAQFRFVQTMKAEQVYWLQFSDSLRDCADRATALDSFPFALATAPGAGDIRISELLFNPHPDGSDFVEIYNQTAAYFDVAHLGLSQWDNGLLELFPLSTQHRLLAPGGLMVFAADLDDLKKQYLAEASTLHHTHLPSMPDAGVSLALYYSDLSLIDRISVKEDYHHPFIGDAEGVSLYRLDFSDVALEPNQWESSPSNVGYASPGRLEPALVKNSKAHWGAEPDYLSPNGDGYHDFLNFHYSLPKAAWIKADLFNKEGKWIKSLCRGEFRSESGQFAWKGRDSKGQLCAGGIYVAVLEYQYRDGHRGFDRCAVVLSQ